jgi:hypothetical protein
MRSNPAIRWLAMTLLLEVGCAGQVEAGLANAQSIESQGRPVRHHDVIANGDDSCPRAPGDNDPLPHRSPPCDGADDAGSPLAMADAGHPESALTPIP